MTTRPGCQAISVAVLAYSCDCSACLWGLQFIASDTSLIFLLGFCVRQDNCDARLSVAMPACSLINGISLTVLLDFCVRQNDCKARLICSYTRLLM